MFYLRFKKINRKNEWIALFCSFPLFWWAMWVNCSFFEWIAHSLIFWQKTVARKSNERIPSPATNQPTNQPTSQPTPPFPALFLAEINISKNNKFHIFLVLLHFIQNSKDVDKTTSNVKNNAHVRVFHIISKFKACKPCISDVWEKNLLCRAICAKLCVSKKVIEL